MNADDAARRPLPTGYDDDESPFFVPLPFRSHFRCVSVDPAARTGHYVTDHETTLDAACAWAYADHVRRHGPGRIPD